MPASPFSWLAFRSTKRASSTSCPSVSPCRGRTAARLLVLNRIRLDHVASPSGGPASCPVPSLHIPLWDALLPLRQTYSISFIMSQGQSKSSRGLWFVSVALYCCSHLSRRYGRSPLCRMCLRAADWLARPVRGYLEHRWLRNILHLLGNLDVDANQQRDSF